MRKAFKEPEFDPPLIYILMFFNFTPGTKEIYKGRILEGNCKFKSLS